MRHLGATVLVGREPPANREPSMNEITTIGLDLAKHVFQVTPGRTTAQARVGAAATSFRREYSRRQRSCLGRFNIARADLHGLARVADDAAPTIVDRSGCPIATGSVNRLGVARVHYISWRPRGNDSASDNGAADDARGNPGPPSPSPPPPIGGRVGRSRGQGHRDRRNRDQTGERLLHHCPPLESGVRLTISIGPILLSSAEPIPLICRNLVRRTRSAGSLLVRLRISP